MRSSAPLPDRDFVHAPAKGAVIASHIRKLTFTLCVSAYSKLQNNLSFAIILNASVRRHITPN